MATKNTQHQAHNHFVVATGYLLFAIIVFIFIVQDIVPLGHALTTPHVRMVNVWAFLVSLGVAMLLPPIISYIAGSSGTRNRSVQVHHYNGVLFALFACWLVGVVDTLDSGLIGLIQATQDSPMSTVLTFSLPVVCVAIIVGILAYYYHRGRSKQVDLLAYKPYQVSFFASIVIVFTGIIVSMLNSSDVLLSIWMTLAVPGGIFAITYVCLMRVRATPWYKLMLAVIGVTLAGATVYAIEQAVIGKYYTALPFIAGSTAGCLVWFLYIYITRQAYGISK